MRCFTSARHNPLRATLLVGSILAGLLAVAFSADELRAGEPTWSKKLLMISPNEGCAIGDINKDGVLDISAGPNWFAGPDFVPRPLRDIGEFADYLHNNSEYLYDINGDGWLDVVSGSWILPEMYWYENPGKELLAKGMKWKQHLLFKGRDSNEIYDMHDFNGDGVPEIFVSCWQKDAPQVVWQLTKNEKGEPSAKRIELGPMGGHGYGFGDLNGDGREDIVTEAGWLERPEGDPLAGPWAFHAETALPHPSCPVLVVDVNGDGRNDLLWGKGHDFGLYYWEQGEPKADGTLTWKKETIDDSWSQPHALVWVDIDGDGAKEMVTGKRVGAHSGNDPGGKEPAVVFYYDWDPKTKKFIRHTIAAEGENVGIGMQIRAADLNGDGKLDLVLVGKSGSWVLTNEGDK
jgi:VCBS repeat protein